MSRATVKQERRRAVRPAPAQGINFNSPVSIFKQAAFLRGLRSWPVVACVPLAIGIAVLWGTAAHAQDAPYSDVQTILDNIFITIAAVLVIFMNAGFGMLETGFCRQKNAVNILSKNLIVFALATLAYWVLGFSLMYGSNSAGGFIGFGPLFLMGTPEAYGYDPAVGLTLPVGFLFQVAFAATAATIVSGAVAERIKFVDFIIFSIFLTGIAYPITGHWVWSGGWLANLGFHDFAGSTVVHSVGGWAALMGAAFLGPRLGKYSGDQTNALPGHNMSLAMLGCLILWIGWFGFNPGSALAADATVPFIAVTTNLAAAAGGVTATFTAWALSGKPDLSMIINGILAGLVGITAGCYVVDYFGAVIIGGLAGILVVFSVLFFDSIKIDDPVGATSVHLVCGVWGTLAVGLFASGNNFSQAGSEEAIVGLFYGGGFTQLGLQIVGILAIGAFTVITSGAFWFILKSTLGLRVTEEEELIGLDIGEHGMEAYSGFLKESSSVGSSVSSSNL